METEDQHRTFNYDTWTYLTRDANRFDISLVNPHNQICDIQGTDYMTGHLFTFLDLDVVCIDSYFVGGSLIGLYDTTQIRISNNGNDFLTITKNGDFLFEKSVMAYDIQIDLQPRGQECTLTQCSGVIEYENYQGCAIECKKCNFNVFFTRLFPYRYKDFDLIGYQFLDHELLSKTQTQSYVSFFLDYDNIRFLG